MVNRDEIVSAVKSMLDSGFSEKDIVSTLADFQLSNEEIQAYLRDAKNNSGPPAGSPTPAGEKPASISSFSPSAPPSPPSNPVVRETAAVMTEQLSGVFEQQAAHQGAVETALEQHSAHISDVQSKVADVHEKVSTMHSAITAGEMDNADIKRRLSGIENQLGEIKADQSAIKLLMQKILESERKILDRIE